MRQRLARFREALLADGLLRTFRRSLLWPFHQMEKIRERSWLGSLVQKNPPAVVFEEIYRRNYWGNAESVSGGGSTLDNTAELRAALPDFFGQFSIQKVYDAPCGAFQWMKEVVDRSDVEYVGADIVQELIDRNIRESKTASCDFRVANLIADPFPPADLWLCRDCLIHLSYADTYRTLENFVRSEINYLLTTTYLEPRAPNTDIRTGEFREIDLFSAPYMFPREVAHTLLDRTVGGDLRAMCLWTREQIGRSLPQMRAAIEHDEAK